MSRAAFVRPLVAMGISSALAAQMLAAPVRHEVPGFSGPGPMLLGDVDADGHVDVIVPDSSGNVFVLRGDGQGGLGPAIVSRDGVGLLTDAKLGDLDGDGRLDIALRGIAPGMRWLAGDGTGRFVLRGAILGLGSRIGLADVDRDGHPDLVDFAGGGLAVARGSANGPLPAVQVPLPPGLTVPFGSAGWSEAADLDGDGNDDLASYGFFSALLLYGNGIGGFDRWQALPQSLFRARQFTDIDDDGDLDQIVASPGNGANIGRNDGGGVFTVVSLPGTAALTTGYATSADLDGDGREDVLNLTDLELLVSMRDANDQFAVVERHAVPRPEVVAVADFDEDGRVDVAVLGAGGVYVLRNAQSLPSGLVAYGTGTPTCRGAIGTTGSRTPNVGAADFRVLCSNAPANATGVLAVGTRASSGVAIPGLGLVLHLGIGWPVAAMTSDAGGAASAPLPLPRSRWLAGLTLHAQSFWLGDAGLGDTCSPAVGELASSRGLRITLQR